MHIVNPRSRSRVEGFRECAPSFVGSTNRLRRVNAMPHEHQCTILVQVLSVSRDSRKLPPARCDGDVARSCVFSGVIWASGTSDR